MHEQVHAALATFTKVKSSPAPENSYCMKIIFQKPSQALCMNANPKLFSDKIL